MNDTVNLSFEPVDNARLANLVRIVYWIVIVAVLGASYYLYIAPYITRLEKVYQQTQMTNAQAQEYLQTIGQSLQKVLALPTPPAAKTQ